MSNSYTWSITALDCVPQVDGLTDYVVVAHWICTGTDGTFSGAVYNTQSFTVDPAKPDYIPFADLTEAEVISWVQAAMTPETVSAVYANIDTQIENQVNPTIVTPPLPWQTPVS